MNHEVNLIQDIRLRGNAMIRIYSYSRRLIGLLLAIIIVTACAAPRNEIPLPPTPNNSPNGSFPLRSPTYRTPQPTFTPLVGGGRIINQEIFFDYQVLILNVGDTFILQKLGDKDSYQIENPNLIIQVAGPKDGTKGDQVFRANGPGMTYVTINLVFSCPNQPGGCQAPMTKQIQVKIIGPNTTNPGTPAYPLMNSDPTPTPSHNPYP